MSPTGPHRKHHKTCVYRCFQVIISFTVIILLILKGSLRAFQAKSPNLTCLPGELKTGTLSLNGALGWGCFGSAYPCFWGGDRKANDVGLKCSLVQASALRLETPVLTLPFFGPSDCLCRC